MAKFKDLARIDKRMLEETNATTVRERAIAAVDANPGVAADRVASILMPTVVNNDWRSAHNRTNKILWQLARDGFIAKRKLDRMRYYPANYVFSDTKAGKKQALPKGVVTYYPCPQCGKRFSSRGKLAPHIRLAHTEAGREAQQSAVKAAGEYRTLEAQARRAARAQPTLAQLAREFAWETGSNDLREFIKWHDSRE